MTNAERIRTMTNEELAWFIKANMFNDFKPCCPKSTFFSADNKPVCKIDCISCITAWLEKTQDEKKPYVYYAPLWKEGGT